MRRSTRLAAAALAAGLLAPAAAGAAPVVDGEFAVSSQPRQLALGPDGNVWVALAGPGSDLARVTPAGAVTEYDLPDLSAPVGVAAGPDGNLWVTRSGGVFRISPADPVGAARTFAIPEIADPRGIVAGPDGNLWTASGDKAVRITPAGAATVFTVPGMGARGIARGGDGKLYVADFGGQRIVGLTTAGVPTFHPTGGGPQEVAAGPDGQIAFTNPTDVPQRLGRFAPGGAVATTDVPGRDPFGIALGGDGAWWTADFATSTLTRFTASGAVTPLAGLSAGSGPRYIAAGAGGTLWVALESASSVARVSGVTAPPPPATPTPQGSSPTPLVPPQQAVRGPARKPRIAVLLVRGGKRFVRVRTLLSKRAVVRFRLVWRERVVWPAPACKKPSRRDSAGSFCVRRTTVRTLTRSLPAGTTRFSLRIPRAGRYELVATARDQLGLEATASSSVVVRP